MSQQQLTAGERKVLQTLLSLEARNSADEIASKLNERSERIISIMNALAERGLIELTIHETIGYELSDEGHEYAENWLPEVRLFGAVKELGGKASVDDAISQANLSPKLKGIAINWARKNGWLGISKEDGTTSLTSLVEEADSPTMRVLKLLFEGSDIPDHLKDGLKTVLQRNLAKESVTKSFEAEILERKIPDIQSMLTEESEGIVNLTPEMIASGSWKGASFRSFNVAAEPAFVNYGRKHPYAEFNDWLKEILIGLGFNEWFGPYVETEFWNNDTLFVPQDHVAREVQDQFRVVKPYDHGDLPSQRYYKEIKAVHENGGDTGSIGWQAPFSKEITRRLVLRAHTTPVSMRYLSEHKEPPQKMFIIDRNFRSESLSARHAMEFNQCEGIIMDKGLTLRDLMGYLSEIVKRVGIKKMKFKPGQFPFTEPSVECFAKHDVLGWIEVAPGGIFRPEVTYPHGVKDTVLAWGIGSGRLYMASMGINDIRELYSRDLAWLRRKYFVR